MLIVENLGICCVFDVDFLTIAELQARAAPEWRRLALMYDELMHYTELI